MFILTKKQRLHGLDCTLPTGKKFRLTFREMTEDEREQFDLERAAISNVPGATPGSYGKKLNGLLAVLAAQLLVSWRGVAGEDRKSLEISDENKALFFADAEARKFWRPYIYGYLWPETTGADGAEDKQDLGPQS